jgi:hypothetical protein
VVDVSRYASVTALLKLVAELVLLFAFAAVGRHVGLQVRLRRLELVQKAVFDEISFIQVACCVIVQRVLAQVPDIQHCVLANFPLYAQRPGLRVGHAQIRIHRVRRITRQRGSGCYLTLTTGGHYVQESEQV